MKPAAVIASHVNEAATTGGRVNSGSKTQQFIEMVKGRPVYVPLSGRTMEFNGAAKCVAGCEAPKKPSDGKKEASTKLN